MKTRQKITRLAVLCSGKGSNLEAIIRAIKSQVIRNAQIKVVIADRQDSFALVRADRQGIETVFLNPKEYPSRDAYDHALLHALQSRKIDLVVLAGFMRILSKALIEAYPYKIVNIHPALLPSFKGAHGIRDALAYGVKVTGVTIHFATADLDAGPIILQKAISVRHCDTEETLAKRIHKVEHQLYPQAINLFVQGNLHVQQGKVKIS